MRAALRFEIAYGQAKEVFTGLEALNVMYRDHEWAPFSGKGEVILTCDSPDVGAYVAERDAAFGNAEWMAAWGNAPNMPSKAQYGPKS